MVNYSEKIKHTASVKRSFSKNVKEKTIMEIGKKQQQKEEAASTHKHY